MVSTLDVGAMVYPVTIQSRTAGVDASGAPQETWADLTTAQMAREKPRGGETFRADQTTAARMTTWVMRYAAAMDPDQVDVETERRLVYRGRTYDIVQAELLGRQVGIVLRTLAHSQVPA